MLASVFVPLLAQQAGGDKHSALMGSGDDRGQSGMLTEFLADLNKFVGQVGQTMHALQGIPASQQQAGSLSHLSMCIPTYTLHS